MVEWYFRVVVNQVHPVDLMQQTRQTINGQKFPGPADLQCATNRFPYKKRAGDVSEISGNPGEQSPRLKTNRASRFSSNTRHCRSADSPADNDQKKSEFSMISLVSTDNKLLLKLAGDRQ
ncbi:MAG: hypothetical protein MK110_00085 [Fuerstiella sp.]|nr:hypothetical protein [Fuerstiella sp.]